VPDQRAAESFADQVARECLSSRVGRLHRIVTRRFELALAETGLTPPQLELLAALVLVGEPVPPSALAGVLAVERSTMSRNLALLKARGWVEPVQVSPTGRAMTVAVSDAGRAVFAGARAAWGRAQREVAAALGDAAYDLDGWLTSLGGEALPRAAP
jgi:DNA-binding MarR family transcriptional regulator